MPKRRMYLQKPKETKTSIKIDEFTEQNIAKKYSNERRKNLYFAIGLVLTLFLIGTFAYEYVEGWDWITSVYFISASMTTIGYRDVVPKTELGRLMTVAFVWIWISAGFYLIYTISEVREHELDERIRGALKRIGRN